MPILDFSSVEGCLSGAGLEGPKGGFAAETWCMEGDSGWRSEEHGQHYSQTVSFGWFVFLQGLTNVRIQVSELEGFWWYPMSNMGMFTQEL